MLDEESTEEVAITDKGNEKRVLAASDLPKGKLFHIFFCYSESDVEFTRRLIEKLEGDYGFQCCEHTRDFKPGWPILDNIKYCVMSSVKTVVVISTDSIKSEWCSYETELTLHMSMDMRKKILIPLLIDDCAIPDHLRPLTYIDARGKTSHWWQKLLLAIESPAEIPVFESGLPSFSSDPFSFNPHYNNLDSLVNLETKYETCVRAEIGTQIVPNALCGKGIQVPHIVFEEQMGIFNRSTLMTYHCCFHRRVCWCVCIVILFLTVFPVAIFFSIVTLSSCSIGRNGHAADCDYSNASGFGSLIPFFILLLFVIFLIVRRKRERSLYSTMADVNASFLPHQVMVTFKSWPWSSGLLISFVYYNYQPCLDYIMSKLHKSFESSSSHQYEEYGRESTNSTNGVSSFNHHEVNSSDHASLLNENVVGNSKFPNETDMPQCDDYSLEQRSKEILLKNSAWYLRLFLDEKLTRPKEPRHTRQVVCLCQYVEDVEKISLSSIQPSCSVDV